MRFGIFEDFKSERTLLVWGIGSDLRPLVDALDDVARGPRTFIPFDRSLGAEAVGDVDVTLELASQNCVLFRQHGEGSTIQLRCSREKCAELAEQLRPLAATPDQVGHHYLEITADQPLQIMVSAGEYPPDLTPA